MQNIMLNTDLVLAVLIKIALLTLLVFILYNAIGPKKIDHDKNRAMWDSMTPDMRLKYIKGMWHDATDGEYDDLSNADKKIVDQHRKDRG